MSPLTTPADTSGRYVSFRQPQGRNLLQSRKEKERIKEKEEPERKEGSQGKQCMHTAAEDVSVMAKEESGVQPRLMPGQRQQVTGRRHPYNNLTVA